MEQRENVIMEIITTEKNYAHKLEAVLDYIIKPLRAQSIIDEVDIKGQFGYWENLSILHTALYQRMVEEYEAKTIEMGRIFKDFSAFLKMYREYIANFDIARARRGYLLTTNKRFADFLDKIKAEPVFKGLGIEAYLIEPIQRIPRYRLLLEALLKYTSDNHPDRDIIAQALQQVSEVAIENNEAIRKRENYDKLMEVITSFETRSRVNLLDDPNRTFLKEGILQKQCRRGIKPFYYWLFSDKLLYGEANGLGSYRLNRQILLSEMRIAKSENPVVFRIESKAKSFITIAKDEAELNEWYNAILNAILAAREEQTRRALDADGETDIAPIWTPNSDHFKCEICGNIFGLILRRHHCRNCGSLVCDPCSQYRCLLANVDPDKPVRICKNCSLSLGPKHEITTERAGHFTFGKTRSIVLRPRSPLQDTDHPLSPSASGVSSPENNPEINKSMVKKTLTHFLLRGRSEGGDTGMSDPIPLRSLSRSSSSPTRTDVFKVSEDYSMSKRSDERRGSNQPRRSNILVTNTGASTLYQLNKQASMNLSAFADDEASDSDLDDPDNMLHNMKISDPPVKPQRNSVTKIPPVPSIPDSDIPTQEHIITAIRKSILPSQLNIFSDFSGSTSRRSSMSQSPPPPGRRPSYLGSSSSSINTPPRRESSTSPSPMSLSPSNRTSQTTTPVTARGSVTSSAPAQPTDGEVIGFGDESLPSPPPKPVRRSSQAPTSHSTDEFPVQDCSSNTAVKIMTAIEEKRTSITTTTESKKRPSIVNRWPPSAESEGL